MLVIQTSEYQLNNFKERNKEKSQEALDKLIAAHFSGGWDYSFNDHFDGVMLGTGSEIVNVDLLRKRSDAPLALLNLCFELSLGTLPSDALAHERHAL